MRGGPELAAMLQRFSSTFKNTLATSLLSLALLSPVWAQGPAEVYLTARESGERLALKGAAPFASMAQPEEWMAAVMVDPSHTYQTIEGIGGALTDASAETFYRLPDSSQNELIEAYYGAKGIGYSLGRTHINSCDFSSESYAYVEKDGDTELASFSLAHDLRYRIPFIQRVLKAQPRLKIFASPWSPPAWMKTNNNMLLGGKLKARYRDSWAQYYVRFIQEYAAQHIPIWGLTVQNEPMASQTWESCIYTAEEERDFVKFNLGPALHKAKLDQVKLMIWDHNRGLMYQRASTVLNDPEAARYVWGTAFHWYCGDEFENEGRVHEAFPDKAILFSEGCCDSFRSETLGEWKWGETYARSMIRDFNNWTCGWTDWNILLDERGGPNHVGNFCFAPVIADTHTGTLQYMSSFYYIGHFSKFVRPGAKRMACTVSQDDLMATAFVNPDGGKVTIVMNGADKPYDVKVWTAGKAAPVTLPAHSIATLVWH